MARSQAPALGTPISGAALLRHLTASTPVTEVHFAESLGKVLKLSQGSLPFWQFPQADLKLVLVAAGFSLRTFLRATRYK